MDRKERVHVLLIAALTLGSVLLEAVGVGLIFPLVKILISPESLFDSPALSYAYRLSGVHDARRFLAVCAIAFLLIIIFKSIYNTLLSIYQERLCHRISARIGSLLIARYMRAPWADLLQRNSADMINVADIMTGWPLTNALRSYPIIATEAPLSVGILILLFYVAPYPALAAIAGFGIALFFVHTVVRRHLVRLSGDNAILDGERIQFLQQSLASIKEIRILGRASRFIEVYAEARRRQGSVMSQLMIWQNIPRAFVEPIAVGAMTAAIVAIAFSPPTDLAGTTAILGLFSVAGMRLTPSLTRMLVATNGIRASTTPVARITRDLAQVVPDQSWRSAGFVPELSREIRGFNISYQYQHGAAVVLRGMSFTIAKGKTVGLMGTSGAGKSTLADIIVGLLTPDTGAVFIDDVNIAEDVSGWHRQIGYIPQSVSLIDASVLENIALGLTPEEIDIGSMRKAIKLARLEALVENLPRGLDTRIGERGVRLSGGERQRIGIARALYNRRTVLVMDEATSALDTETESDIGEAIAVLRGQYTILIIAHRHSTIRRCDTVMLLKGGQIVDSGTPEEIATRHSGLGELGER